MAPFYFVERHAFNLGSFVDHIHIYLVSSRPSDETITICNNAAALSSQLAPFGLRKNFSGTFVMLTDQPAKLADAKKLAQDMRALGYTKASYRFYPLKDPSLSAIAPIAQPMAGGAQAFTSPGFAFGTQSSELQAYELVHVVQQGAGKEL